MDDNASGMQARRDAVWQAPRRASPESPHASPRTQSKYGTARAGTDALVLSRQGSGVSTVARFTGQIAADRKPNVDPDPKVPFYISF